MNRDRTLNLRDVTDDPKLRALAAPAEKWPVVFQSGVTNWLAAGHDQLDAAKARGETRLRVALFHGGFPQALAFAQARTAPAGAAVNPDPNPPPTDPPEPPPMANDATGIKQVNVNKITVGDRVRKAETDLATLQQSLQRVGMLQPIVCDSQLNLVAGGRRLAAARQLGWKTVPVVKVKSLDDAILALVAERDENTCREPLSPTEMVELGRRLEALEKPKAAERKAATQAKPGEGKTGAGNLPAPENSGETREKVGEALGVSGSTYAHAKEVVEAAEADPERNGDLPEKMDAESVNAAHKELKKREQQATDAWGVPIQPHAAEAFSDLPQFKELTTTLRKAARLFNELANRPGGKFLTLPTVASYRRGAKDKDTGEATDRFVMPELEAALQKVKAATPAHTVCPWRFVKADHPDDCPTCLGQDWTTPLTKNAEVAKDAVRKAFGVEG